MSAGVWKARHQCPLVSQAWWHHGVTSLLSSQLDQDSMQENGERHLLPWQKQQARNPVEWAGSLTRVSSQWATPGGYQPGAEAKALLGGVDHSPENGVGSHQSQIHPRGEDSQLRQKEQPWGQGNWTPPAGPGLAQGVDRAEPAGGGLGADSVGLQCQRAGWGTLGKQYVRGEILCKSQAAVDVPLMIVI